MARTPRPRVLAAGFGVYFLLVGFIAWQFAQTLPTAWYLADITRWVYTTYMLVGAVFLVGLGGLGLSVRRSFGAQIADLDKRLGSASRGAHEALPPPLPETANTRDRVDRDIDELLESLSEVQESAQQEAVAMGLTPEPAMATGAGADSEARRERLVQRRRLLGRYLIGPGLVASFILGLSGMMLPGADGFAQFNHQLNSALILGIGYSWVGVGWYVAATVYALVSDGRRR